MLAGEGRKSFGKYCRRPGGSESLNLVKREPILRVFRDPRARLFACKARFLCYVAFDFPIDWPSRQMRLRRVGNLLTPVSSQADDRITGHGMKGSFSQGTLLFG